MSQTQPEVRVLMEDIFGSDSEGEDAEQEQQELKEGRKSQEKEDGEIENSSDEDKGKPKTTSSKSKGVSFENSGIFGSDDESQARASDDSGEALSPKRKILKGSKSRVSISKKDSDLVDSDAEEEVANARKKPKISRKRVRPGEKEGADAGKERVRNRIKRSSGIKRKEKGTKSPRLTSNEEGGGEDDGDAYDSGEEVHATKEDMDFIDNENDEHADLVAEYERDNPQNFREDEIDDGFAQQSKKSSKKSSGVAASSTGDRLRARDQGVYASRIWKSQSRHLERGYIKLDKEHSPCRCGVPLQRPPVERPRQLATAVNLTHPGQASGAAWFADGGPLEILASPHYIETSCGATASTTRPSFKPSSPKPSFEPSNLPSTIPTSQPYLLSPSFQPSTQPRLQPTTQPSTNPSQPTSQPSTAPSQPSLQPTSIPTSPTTQPTSIPSSPTSQPYSSPTKRPNINPSTSPSRQPTSMPSCPEGTSNSDCESLCPAGTYSPALGSNYCKDCALDYYQPRKGQLSCLECPYPSITTSSRSTSCKGICLQVTSKYVAILLTGIAAIFLIAIFILSGDKFKFPTTDMDEIRFTDEVDNPAHSSTSGCHSWLADIKAYYIRNFARKKQLALLLILGLPVLDTITNLWYILKERYYSLPIFYISWIVFLHGTVIFVAKLYFLGAVPIFPPALIMTHSYLSVTTSTDLAKEEGRPTKNTSCFPIPKFGVGVFPLFVPCICDDQLHLVVCLWVLVCWILATVLQFFIWLAIIVFWLPGLIIWFLLGVVLQSTKVIALGRVWNIWFYVWTGGESTFSVPELGENETVGPRSPDCAVPQTAGDLDTEDFNNCSAIHQCVESFPLLILQIVNSSQSNAFNSVAITSITFSAMSAIYSLWGIIYRRWFQFRTSSTESQIDVEMVNVPVSVLEMQIPPSQKEVKHNFWRWWWSNFNKSSSKYAIPPGTDDPILPGIYDRKIARRKPKI